MRQIYRLRKVTSGAATGHSDSYSIGVPKEIADLLVGKGFDLFTVSLTDQGILFQPVKAPIDKSVPIPEWLR